LTSKRFVPASLFATVAASLSASTSCSAVLGLDEPTHRGEAMGAGGANQAGSSGAAVDASASGGSSVSGIDGSGGISGGPTTGGNGGSSAAGAAQGSTDAASDVGADVGVDAGPRCDDGKKNGNETGTDCGGTCGGCPTGSPCKVAGDCSSKNCTQTTCAKAHCTTTSPACRCVGVMPGTADYLVCDPVTGMASSWDMARLECQNRGMHLAKIDDAAEGNFLNGYMDPALRDYWVGASSPTGQPMTWQWLDKTPIPTDFWVMGTQWSPNYRCAALSMPPKLILGICEQSLGYICEIE
jgi:Lectin C-type domain